MKKRILLSASLCTMLLSSCSSLPDMPKMPDMSKFIPSFSLPTLYKEDMNQGSVLSRFAVNQLKVGMSKTQVRSLIGSPSIIDPFHNNQWDYINHSNLHKKDDIRYRLILTFEKEILVNIDASQLESLPALTDSEKALEQDRINAELKATEIKKNQALARIKAEQAKAEKLEAIKAEKIETEKKRQAEKIKQEQEVSAQQLKTTKVEEVINTTTPKVITHTVKKGETLWHIAQTYDIDVSQLAKQNEITVSSILSIGQQLIIAK